MRALPLLLCLVFLAGCVRQQKTQPEAVEIPPTIYFIEDFASGKMAGWAVEAKGGAGIQVVDNKPLRIDKAVEVRSQGHKLATAAAPKFKLDYGGDYAVSFDFMLRHRENYGLVLFEDRFVRIVLEHGTGVACVSGGQVEFLGRVNANEWHTLAVEVSPRYSEYDVYLDRELTRSCDFTPGDIGSFRFGDPDPGDTVYGDCLWDNFRVTDRL
jgi:hypothetical protein